MNGIKKSLLSMVAMAGIFMFTATPRLRADDPQEECQKRVAHAQHELQEAIERHGRHSRQADHERRELRAERERCWNRYHRWWDEREHRWHEEHDWDDRDRDRD